MTVQDQVRGLSSVESIRPANDSRPVALSVREILSRPLPGLADDWVARTVLRGFLLLFRRRVIDAWGLDQIATRQDPFILALNHNTQLEALLVPMLLIHYRGGRFIHFLSDWNFQLIPGLAYLLRRSEVITLVQKPARPRFLNRFKHRFENPTPAFERARLRLAQGAPVGIYPEGTMNRDPRRLLPGRLGAARLSLSSGARVVPGGIRFPEVPSSQPIPAFARMHIEMGEPLVPPRLNDKPTLAEIRDWHACIMQEIARLSRKEWPPRHHRRDAC